MKKFEYKVVEKFDTGLKGEKKLNALGEEGWELAGVMHTDGFVKSSQMIFKRELA